MDLVYFLDLSAQWRPETMDHHSQGTSSDKGPQDTATGWSHFCPGHREDEAREARLYHHHYSSQAYNTDSIAVLHNGCFVEQGMRKHTELIATRKD